MSGQDWSQGKWWGDCLSCLEEYPTEVILRIVLCADGGLRVLSVLLYPWPPKLFVLPTRATFGFTQGSLTGTCSKCKTNGGQESYFSAMRIKTCSNPTGKFFNEMVFPRETNYQKKLPTAVKTSPALEKLTEKEWVGVFLQKGILTLSRSALSLSVIPLFVVLLNFWLGSSGR